jgi:acyl-CoA synthetase (AMP-forming)/AMP-acid ligase II
MMASLIYRVLDEHVIHGLADNLAIQDERGTMSYAELLHESASVAGAFTRVGIGPGAGVQIELEHGRELVVAVLACARIGAVPRSTADFRLTGTPAVLRTSDTEVPWDLLIHAGRVDPAPAPPHDPEGYEALMRRAYADIFAALEAGETIST